MKSIACIFFLLPLALCGGNRVAEMISVNSKWLTNPDGVGMMESVELQCDPVIRHLILVERTLRQRPVGHLSEKQKENRLKNLEVLKKYAEAGIVPTNDYRSGRVPVFIDRQGVYCAVGHLIKESGHEALARSIDAKQKFAYIHEIDHPGLVQWQTESGLSLDELAWIQPTYNYPGYASGLANGLRGEVKDLKKTTGKYSFLAAGCFVTDSGPDSVLLAGFDGQVWHPVFTGKGMINKLELLNGKIISYGTMSGHGLQNIEIVETDIIPSIPLHKSMADLNGEILNFEYYGGKKYVCGKFSGGLAYESSGSWVSLTSDYFVAPAAICTYNGYLYICGDKPEEFYGYILSRYNGNKIESVISGNQGYTPYPQQALAVYKNKLYIGLRSNKFDDSMIFTFNGTSVTLAVQSNYIYGKEIKNFIPVDTTLIVTGNIYSGNFYSGTGLVLCYSEDPDDGRIFLNLNGYVNAAVPGNNGDIYIGGFFSKFYKKGPPNVYQELNSVGVAHSNYVGIPDIHGMMGKPSISPNPFTDIFSIVNMMETDRISIFDLQGREIKNSFDCESRTVNLQGLVCGIYYILISREEGQFLFKAVKQ